MTEFGRVITQNEHNLHNGNFKFVNLPFERGEILFSKGFDFTDIRKLQAEISNLFAKLYYFEQRCENATVGLWRISGHTGGCERCVLDALKTGYRAIDTAQSYFNEEQVGAAIEKSGVDHKDIFLTTKVWIEHYGYEKPRLTDTQILSL